MDDSMDVLITKKLTGRRLSEREEMILRSWLESDPAHRKQFLQLKLIHQREAPEILEKYEKEVWGLLKKNITQGKPQQVFPAILKWAAVFLIISSTLAIIYYQKAADVTDEVLAMNFIEKVCLPGQKITTVLPDGTTVRLNSDSKLIVPEKFTGDERVVKLEGEAYFEVARDTSMPFIVEVSDYQVKVLGTAFNINDIKRQVAVRTGKVSVQSASGKHVELSPDEMVSITNEGLSDIKSFDATYVFGWTDQKLVFVDNDINEVFDKVERWFDVKVNYPENGDKKDLFNGTFNNPTLKEVLSSISKAYNINYEITHKNIRISK
ncbi:MAG: FecR domain-containing protein [Cyclobacteriaceae bacterium]